MALELMWVAIIMLAAQINSASRPECPTTCGNLTIPFPFGTSSECHHQDSDAFLIICNYSYNPPKPFLNLGSSIAEVLEVSIDGLIKVSSSVASDCYSKSGSQISSTISELTSSKFPLSSTQNKFTAVGCDTYALVEGSNEWKNMSAGCVSWCDTAESVINGTCSGSGCCQTTIPKGVKDFFVDIRSFRNHTMVKGFNPCGYAFVVESEAFEFSSLDLKDLRNRKTFPVILDWSIGSETCTMARKNLSSYACRATESKCSDSRNGLGYICNCLSGYQGNPYIIDGCQDIDECATISKPCEGICKNLQGNYSCSCAEGFEGDGMKNGSGCHPKSQMKGSMLFYITSGFMIPAIGSSWIFWRRKQKKLVKLRQNLFQRNGGLVLENMLRRQDTLVIFTAEELKRATDNYDENRIIHSGNAYKGFMSIEGVNRVVTIKKCNRVDESQIEVFINKLVTLSRLHHKNMVKLIGCCLETQVPLLVYEFITVTTLDDFSPFNAASLSWDIRLRIASETAGALAYMHSAAALPITHGNFSSSSILLHRDYTAKVHDFACDVPSNSQVSRLDPEYCHSGILTVKSDVYSFGTFLAELLTGKKWSNFKRQVGEEYFVSSSDKNELNSILDQRLATEGNIEQLTEIAKLAGRCLSESSLERPTMKQVEMALISACNGSSSSTAIRQISSLKTTARRLMRRNRSL
ncbi:hypothetical protein ACJIZ3_024749 [Penstemon smallii]|uniref:Uncharacterized protein n=1 Tax=Penstemon smallii TaxID=265156 RepID=A0ABD3TUX5_9LAMI